ncbi:MAG TPA: MnhB domain-containing protein [Opitutales bacterium]|nr:MnhB domain-containing protein [Opitutales bacterium]
MIGPSYSIVVRVVVRLVARVVQLFGIYVIFHGHYSPGGGFQGGALLAAGFILVRLTDGFRVSQLEFPSHIAIPLAGLGGLLFFVVGFLAMTGGGMFLEYPSIPIGLSSVDLRYYGILVVEIGIAAAVAAALVSIFDNLVGGPPDG